MLEAMLAQAEACIGSLPPASLGLLLGGLIGRGVAPPGRLLSAAAELAVANMGSSGVPALVELLQVCYMQAGGGLCVHVACCRCVLLLSWQWHIWQVRACLHW
jgi:hypothetical protein